MAQYARDILLISTEPPEVRVAQLREGRLFDLFIERGGRLLNSIFKGRVENVVSGMDAAFIDIGLPRNALIYAGDIARSMGDQSRVPISKLVKAGEELIVQVARPPVGTKGARVTTNLSLTGRYAILSTNDDKVGISRRIENSDDRNRLRRIAEKIRPLDHGLILRTEAEGAPESALAKDAAEISANFSKIRSRAASLSAPALLYREAGLLGRLIRDRFNDSVEAIWVDTVEEFELLQSLVSEIAPAAADRLHFYDATLHSGQPTLFEKFNVVQEITAAQNRVVTLPNGGSLAIDETEALCAIDVNTGKFTGKTRLSDTVLQTNLEAVEAAARQIRLRNLSGVIVIDFIDMERQKDRVAVLDALEAALSQDHSRTRIVQLSPSGLVEITRRRESSSLRQLLKRPCPYCNGAGVIKSPATVALETRAQVRRRARDSSFPTDSRSRENLTPLISVTVHPEPACAFLGPANEYVTNLEETTGAQVWLQANPYWHQEAVAVEAFDPSFIDPSPGRRLEIGATISAPVQLARFPAKDPMFIAWNQRLVFLTNMREWQNQTGSKCEIKIDEVGRWYATGHILTPNSEPKPNP